MFDAMFKRAPSAVPSTETAAPAALAPGQTPQRAAAVERLQSLGDDETACADFVLQCEFSELRLVAAERIHSQDQLERVHSAIRNLDRRVAKLLQGRLDAIRHHQSELVRGQACIDQAMHLLAEQRLTPNHVADLDRSWSVVAAPELAATFDALRANINARLDAQTALQRAVIDRVAALRQLGQAELPPAELSERLAVLAIDHATALDAPEHASLPRQLLAEFASEHARLCGGVVALEQQQEAEAARAAQAASAAPPIAKPARPKAQAPVDPQFVATLDAMEAALQQGALQAAADHDKALKENKAARLTAALADRLAHARAELKRLSDWARWSGNVSREELIKAVEQLAGEKLAMSELAKKVGSMRERWKGLDVLSGPAPKGLWERFDRACSAAYAPAAAHFKHLAEERHANAAKARALIDEATAAAAQADGAQPDWKQLASTVQHLKLGWSHLGAIDRKDKKKLDTRFTAALAALAAPLAQQRKQESGRREQLIAEVTALNPADRHSLDALRRAQEQWQELARALPLERKAEQALWQRFRTACDAVFAKRKESAHAADAERHAHQSAKEAICARLEEAATSASAADATRLLREAQAQWRAIGAVPRANEAKLEKRHQGAIGALERIIDQTRRQAGAAQATALRDKLRLCQAIEASIAGEDANADDWAARWDALPALSSEIERSLKGRWQAAVGALGGDRAAYARLLEQNRATLLREVLRLEIVGGIDSGSEFARDRLKLQVEVLQSSLKSGQKPVAPAAQLLQLCAMPALADARTASRIEQLFRRIGKDGK